MDIWDQVFSLCALSIALSWYSVVYCGWIVVKCGKMTWWIDVVQLHIQLHATASVQNKTKQNKLKKLKKQQKKEGTMEDEVDVYDNVW